MFCPTCNEILQKLSVTTSTGTNFSVDHCGRCGGTWFDPYEIHRIPYHEVVRIASLSYVPNRTTVEPPLQQLCPRCRKVLETYQSGATPGNVLLLWCRKCLGIWASQKALWEFKKHEENEDLVLPEAPEKPFPRLSVIFYPAIALILLFMVTFVTMGKLRESREDRARAAALITNSYVQPVNESSVIIYFQTASPVKSAVSFGPSILELSVVPVSDVPTTDHHITLDNLLPHASYVYRLILTDEKGNTYTSELMKFTTGK
jgi:Zn-finger nucleic acid-binding protein